MTRRFTVEEVTEVISKFGLDAFVRTLVRGRWSAEAVESKVELSIGTATLVDAKWGEEGGGEHIWIVFKIGDDLYQINGFYSSWEGPEWNDSTIIPVKAEQVMRTIYVNDEE
jgi:hypothetical protein